MDDQVSEELVMTKSPPALKHIDLSSFVVEIEVGMGGSKKQHPPPCCSLLITHSENADSKYSTHLHSWWIYISVAMSRTWISGTNP